MVGRRAKRLWQSKDRRDENDGGKKGKGNGEAKGQKSTHCIFVRQSAPEHVCALCVQHMESFYRSLCVSAV